MTIDEAKVILIDLIEHLKDLEKCDVYLWLKDMQAIDIAVKVLEENQELKADYERLQEEIKLIDINAANVQKEYEKEIKELKRLLKLAVEDFERFRYLMSSTVNKDFCEKALEYHFNPYDLCNSCPLSGSAKCKWKHAGEAMKLIGE